MAKRTSASDDVPPAPPAEVMTPDPPDRAPLAKDEPAPRAWENMPKGWTPTLRDTEALFEATARICRLRGYNDHFLPSHAGDIDLRGVSAEVVGLVDFARRA